MSHARATVRAIPRNDLLTWVAELGVVAVA